MVSAPIAATDESSERYWGGVGRWVFGELGAARVNYCDFHFGCTNLTVNFHPKSVKD